MWGIPCFLLYVIWVDRLIDSVLWCDLTWLTVIYVTYSGLTGCCFLTLFCLSSPCLSPSLFLFLSEATYIHTHNYWVTLNISGTIKVHLRVLISTSNLFVWNEEKWLCRMITFLIFIFSYQIFSFILLFCVNTLVIYSNHAETAFSSLWLNYII